jgi:hypothetical protein
MALIQVLGTGCSKCGHLLKNAEEAAGQLNNDDVVEKVAFAHEALSSEIEQGNIVWMVADYTTEENKSIVDQCKVSTSTVVLVEVSRIEARRSIG